jgi:hypothetical protein
MSGADQSLRPDRGAPNAGSGRDASHFDPLDDRRSVRPELT